MVGRKIPDVAVILKLLEIFVISRDRIFMRERHNFAAADLDPAHLTLPSKSSCNLGGIFLASSSDKIETEDRLGIGTVKDGIRKESATIPIQFGEETKNSLLHQIELQKKSNTLIEFRNWLRAHL